MLELEMRLQIGLRRRLHRAQPGDAALDLGEQRRTLPSQFRAERLGGQRAPPVPEPPVPPAPGRPTLAAVHAADPAPAHRRLAAGPVVVLAPSPAARREAQIAAPVAVPQRTHGAWG
jgi:hypothetical protein